MPRIPSRATTLLLLTPATVALAGAAANGDIFQWMNDPTTYGHLCQYSIPNELAEESCAPTSATNVLVHLQNTHAASLGGIQLVGEGYDGWISTAETLQGNFGTTNEEGSSGPGQTAGLEDYITSIGAANRFSFEAMSFETEGDYPSWTRTGVKPAFGDFYDWMSSGAGVYVDVIYDGTGPGGVQGHVVALVGLDWNDANGDGVVDYSEGATFSVIDPLDPSQNYDGSDVLGPPKLTSISVWQDEVDGFLNFSYTQYLGNLPFDELDYGTAVGIIGGGVAMSVVVPGPFAGAIVAAVGLCRRRRRR